MRISKVVISNYRSLLNIEVLFQSMVAIIGENNSGKSNILTALDLFFSASKKKLNEECFAFKDCKRKITITITFIELNSLEKHEFSKGGWILSDGSVCIKREFYCDDDGEYQIDMYGWREEPVASHLREENVKEYAKKSTIDEHNLPDYFVAETGRVTQTSYKEGLMRYISENRDKLEFEKEWKKNPRGYKEVIIGFLPEYFLVPAIRDVADEEKITTTTLFGRLMNAVIVRILTENESVAEIGDQIKQLADRLNRPETGQDTRFRELIEFEQELTATLNDCMTNTNVNLEILPPDLERIFQIGTRIVVDDGLDTYLESKGHGMQRAMLFALFRCYANLLQKKVEKPDDMEAKEARRSFIFAIEEPELFLHPQLQRKMFDLIKAISETDQVVFCTHSPSFVRMDQHKSITIISKPSHDQGSAVYQYVEEIFQDAGERSQFRMLTEFDPERSEMFFGKKIVLVEGDAEKTSLPLIAKALGVYSHDISVVECGGKYNLPFFINVLMAFNLPFEVVHDEDPIPDDIKPGQEKYPGKKKTFEYNKAIRILVDNSDRIHMLEPDFESVAGISRTEAKNLGKPFAAFRHFREMAADKVPVRLREVVQSVYRL